MHFSEFLVFSLFLKRVLTLKSLTENTNNNDTTTKIENTISNLFTQLNVKENEDIEENYRIHRYFTTMTKENNQNIYKSFENHLRTNNTDLLTYVIDEILNEDAASNNESVKSINSALKKLGALKGFLNHKVDATAHTGALTLFVENENLKRKITNESVQDDHSSDVEFWQPSGRRIYQGKRTKVKYFPFMASIEVFNKFQCGGSIIKSDLVITAASCLQLAWNNRFFRENPAFLAVRVGSTYYNGGGEVIPVLEVYFHPSYNPKNLRSNICLLRLQRRIKFRRRTKRVRKIDIDREDNPLPLNTDGVAVVGWGAKRASNIVVDPWENRLSFSVLDVYPMWDCKDVYSSQYVTKDNFCAGFLSKGGGACNHDVGGPGIVNGLLAGIISFGAPVCGASDAPTVFVKVGFYADWIDEIMSQDVPHGKKRTTLKPPVYTHMPSYKPETTTFIIEPLRESKLEDEVTINKELRQSKSDNKGLFKEFLRTMFNEEEIKQYADLIDETEIDNDNIGVNETKSVTKLDFETSEVTETYQNKITQEIQVKRLSKTNLIKPVEIRNTENKKTSKSDKNENKDLKITDENILTLLYLSDDEKKEMAERTDNESGLGIATDPFKDLTFRSNSSNAINSIHKDEFYDLIAEIIDETEKRTKR
uniref:Peptidase S1 domain-containing protein n=2 Tax=Bombyx mori TaxID=7091 RepID=A0A8R2AND7_BOMMO|nr:transmembrane protease serine 11B-like protein isoform X1 [Bombyx mori]